MLYIAAWCRLQRRVFVIAGVRNRRLAFAGVSLQPVEPVIPPASRLLLGILEPGLRVFGDPIVGPVMTLLLGRRIDDAGDVP
ncbi:hypothetical protein D3C76_1715780 [compost metagenome]